MLLQKYKSINFNQHHMQNNHSYQTLPLIKSIPNEGKAKDPFQSGAKTKFEYLETLQFHENEVK